MYSVDISKAAIGAFIYVFDEKKAPLKGADIYFNGTLTGTTNEYGRSNFPSLVTGSYLVDVRKIRLYSGKSDNCGIECA